MIRRLGSLTGKRIYFGYDRYLVPELDAYREILGEVGQVIEAVDHNRLHYLTSAELVCRSVQADAEAFGVLCCGTGMGMSIAANKFAGIYAARCTSADDSEMCRTINNANVVCIASKQGLAMNATILHTFASTAYTGRKLEELEYITSFEASPFLPPVNAALPAGPRSFRRTA